MAYCPMCENEVLDDEDTCSSCGFGTSWRAEEIKEEQRPKISTKNIFKIVCQKRGAQNQLGNGFCGSCGDKLPEVPVIVVQDNDSAQRLSDEPVSKAMWILPVLFGITGGLIAWLIVRDRDSKEAQKLLIGGVVWNFLLPFILWLILYLYASAAASSAASAVSYVLQFSNYA